MGVFLLSTAFAARIPDLTYCETFLLCEMAKSADDNTELVTLSNGAKRQNKIGGHVFTSLKRLAKETKRSRAALSNAAKSLVEKGYIQLVQSSKENSQTTNMYHVNVSKIIRVLDYQKTVQVLNLDIDDEDVQKFYQSAIRTYEDDFNNPPFTSLTTEVEGLVIDDWEDKVDKNELENLWTTYREKKNSNSEHSMSSTNKTHMKKNPNNTLHHDVMEQENSIMIISTTTRSTY